VEKVISADFSGNIDFNGQIIRRITLLPIRRQKILKNYAAKSGGLLERRRFPIRLNVWGVEKIIALRNRLLTAFYSSLFR